MVGIEIYETKKGQQSFRADFCPISTVTCHQTVYTYSLCCMKTEYLAIDFWSSRIFNVKVSS